ncbi:MAG: ferrous iron transport protein B [bacterium JZ-2024 1]
MQLPSCHEMEKPKGADGAIVLVGMHNVGKSSLFGQLTHHYVTVSNYGGTTVTLMKGSVVTNGTVREIVDTPGILSFSYPTDEEALVREILLRSDDLTVVLVGDYQNLARTLAQFAETAEFGHAMILVLNLADEAHRNGIEVDLEALEAHLGVPVVATVASTGKGVDRLLAHLPEARKPKWSAVYPAPLEEAIARVESLIAESVHESRRRAAARVLLAGDTRFQDAIGLSSSVRARLRSEIHALQSRMEKPISFALVNARLQTAEDLAEKVVRTRQPQREWLSRQIGDLMIHPVWALPFLLTTLFLMYEFVGVFGAGFLVDWTENWLLGEKIVPLLSGWVRAVLPFPLVVDFLAGEFGQLTMALPYAIGIILPIVTTFFLFFGFLEDTGYMSRVAVVLHRLFRVMGLSGRAVLPMMLGLGCDTMATVSTRILESRKEKIIVTFLLALGVPCSAQLAVILAFFAGLPPWSFALWASVIAGLILAVGALSSQVIPGPSASLIIEIPPLRVPSASNILAKTLARLEWYLTEAVPLFMGATAVLFVLDRAGILPLIESAVVPLTVGWLGLPRETAGAFLMGFLRRDYGAAGLFHLFETGALDAIGATVALITITLFVPCVANFLMIARERGWKMAIATALIVFPLAFLVGGLVNRGLR